MASGGAWQSEYFDKQGAGPGLQSDTPLPTAMGVQATPPAMYNTTSTRSSSKGRGATIVSLALRLLTFLFALIALALVIAGKGSFGVARDGSREYTIRTVRFSVMGAGKYLLAACAIVVVYSLAMVVLDIVGLCTRDLANNKALLLIAFLLDQVMAYVLIAAGAAAANAVIASTNAENVTGLKGTLSCANLGITGLCSKAAAAVAMAFVAFLFLAITSVLSARRFFRN